MKLTEEDTVLWEHHKVWRIPPFISNYSWTHSLVICATLSSTTPTTSWLPPKGLSRNTWKQLLKYFHRWKKPTSSSIPRKYFWLKKASNFRNHLEKDHFTSRMQNYQRSKHIPYQRLQKEQNLLSVQCHTTNNSYHSLRKWANHWWF